MPPVIQVQKLFKTFGPIKALNDLTVDIHEGDRVALLGPNGAGKSTLLKIVSAQMLQSSGNVKVLGYDTQHEREEVKKRVGVVGHNSYLYNELTLIENLRFYGQFYGAKPEDYDKVIETTELQRWRNVKAGHLSFGLRKRGDIARALLGNPRVLLLDEFFSGLDPDTSKSLVAHFKRLDDKTMLISSHSIVRVRQLCNRSIHLRRGVLEKDEVF